MVFLIFQHHAHYGVLRSGTLETSHPRLFQTKSLEISLPGPWPLIGLKISGILKKVVLDYPHLLPNGDTLNPRIL